MSEEQPKLFHDIWDVEKIRNKEFSIGFTTGVIVTIALVALIFLIFGT